MRILICKVCGKSFTAKRLNASYCKRRECQLELGRRSKRNNRITQQKCRDREKRLGAIPAEKHNLVAPRKLQEKTPAQIIKIFEQKRIVDLWEHQNAD